MSSVDDRAFWRPSVCSTALIVGCVALSIRLAILLRAPAFIIGDSENYYFPGYQLARQIGFDLDLRRTPGYPLFIAFSVDSISEDLAALLLAQHLLGVGTCLLSAALTRWLYGAWAGLLAGIATALAAPMLVAGHYVMAEAPFIPLTMLALALLCLALHRRNRLLMLVGGLVTGAASLTRPIGLVLAIALAIALLVQERSPRRAAVLGAPAVLGLALLLAPWIARNALVHGSLSADGNAGQTLVGRVMRHDRGFNFLDPNDPDPTSRRAREIMQGGRGGFVSPARDRMKRELGLDDASANRLMRDLALDALRRQPAYYLSGTAAGFLRLVIGTPENVRDHWNSRGDARNREEWEAHPEIRNLLGPPSPLQEQQIGTVETLLNIYQPARFGPLLPLLAVVGAAVALAGPHRGAATLLFLTGLGLLATAVVLVAPLPRYRYPVEPIITILAAGAVAWLVGGAWRVSWVRRGVARVSG